MLQAFTYEEFFPHFCRAQNGEALTYRSFAVSHSQFRATRPSSPALSCGTLATQAIDYERENFCTNAATISCRTSGLPTVLTAPLVSLAMSL